MICSGCLGNCGEGAKVIDSRHRQKEVSGAS